MKVQAATWRDAVKDVAAALTSAGVGNIASEARWLVEEACGSPGARFELVADQRPSAHALSALDAMLRRRCAGEPLAYVLGHWSFRSLELLVDRRVLVPRPETELVCDVALAALDAVVATTDRRSPAGSAPRVVDLGTGTGALALAIATERPATDVVAVERSAGAAAVARANHAALGRAGRRVQVIEGSWFDGVPPEWRGRVDVVVSNPPYVAAGDSLPPAVADWEPPEALVSGPTGLEAIERVVSGASEWLRPGGPLVVEIGETQGDEALAFAQRAGLAGVEVVADLNDRPRVLRATAPG